MSDQNEELLHRLNQCLDKFGATSIQELSDRYAFYPDLASSKLGSGSYGEAFRVKSVNDTTEPIRVVKVIAKARVTRTALQVQHLCAELAVTGLMKHSNLNRRAGLFHNRTHVFLVLELCEGPPMSLRTRVAHLLALHKPSRIPEIPELLQRWEEESKQAEYPSVDQYVERTGKLRTLMAEIGAKREMPVGTDLFNLIVAMKRFPDPLSAIILKQTLVALNHMHENQVVHRDIKTENVVVSIERDAELITDEEGGPVTGVRIREKVHCKLIDFGLVKYMNLSNFPLSPSPGVFERATGGEAPADPFQQGGAMNFGPPAAAEPKNTLPAPTTNNNNNLSAFPVAVTPCGTELYCSLEVIDGILSSGVGRSKWISSSELLPKMDVYGIGTAMFCMANGRPPFRPPAQYRQVSREEKIRQIQRLIQAGPVFGAHVSENAQSVIRSLMMNDPRQRPTASQALNHPFLQNVGSAYVFEVRANGSVSHTLEQPATAATTADAAPSNTNDTIQVTAAYSSEADTDGSSNKPTDAPPPSAASQVEEGGSDDDEQGHVDDIMAALRGQEDQGDAQGKDSQ